VISRVPQLLSLLALAVALAVAGCGDDEEPQGRKLPPQVAQTLMQQLESIGDRVAAGVAGACDDIYSDDPDVGNLEPIDAALDSIPSDVDPEIRSALEQSIERLTQLVDRECSEIRSAEQEEQEPIEEEEPPPEPVETETETAPDETTEEPPDTTPTERGPSPPDPEARAPQGRGPDGGGPPGQERGGAEAPDDEGEDD
jgi:hypothetical protein